MGKEYGLIFVSYSFSRNLGGDESGLGIGSNSMEDVDVDAVVLIASNRSLICRK